MKSKIDRNYIEGHIEEIRTSKDGNYDFTYNCWAANEFLIITNLYIYKFTVANALEEGQDEAWWIVKKIQEYNKSDYPFSLKSFSNESFVFEAHYEYDSGWDEDIEIRYEDVYLWIKPTVPNYSLFSLQGGNVSESNIVYTEDFKSKYISWDESDDYYRIEFIQDDTNF